MGQPILSTTALAAEQVRRQYHSRTPGNTTHDNNRKSTRRTGNGGGSTGRFSYSAITAEERASLLSGGSERKMIKLNSLQ